MRPRAVPISRSAERVLPAGIMQADQIPDEWHPVGDGRLVLRSVIVGASSVDPPEFELMTYTPVGVRLPEPPRGLPLRLEVKEKDQNTGTPEPYYGKTLFQGFAVFDGQDFIPFSSFHRLPIFWDGR